MDFEVTPTEEFHIAPCLVDGPLSQEARDLVKAARLMGESPAASAFRIHCVARMFEERERIFASQEEPVSAFRSLLRSMADSLRALRESGLSAVGVAAAASDDAESDSVEAITGGHYGHLFEGFSPESFWDETLNLLKLRLERNRIDPEVLRNKSLLDAGCGGGRYASAWRILGARPVVGVDISPRNIADAEARAREAKLSDVRFQVGDVLSLPFDDETFDVVFSNGVLHHTREWKTGIAEVMRVLRPGGNGWLYVIEKPGGLFWDSIEILRVITRDEDRATARRVLKLLGYPGNRIFYMLDHVMAPINLLLEPSEVEQTLVRYGAKNLRRLRRGTDFDRIERIYQQEPYAEVKYGVGENRYWFSK